MAKNRVKIFEEMTKKNLGLPKISSKLVLQKMST